MAYQPLEELLPKADFSIYRLVRLASKRAMEISETGTNLINASKDQKIATTALEEIRHGKVFDKTGVHLKEDKQEKPRKSK